MAKPAKRTLIIGSRSKDYIRQYTLTLQTATGETFTTYANEICDVIAFTQSLSGSLKRVEVGTGLTCDDREIEYALGLLDIVAV